MVTLGSTNYYVVLANAIGAAQTVYIFKDNLSTGVTLICSHTNTTGDYILEKIEILPYNLTNHPFKVLIGASRSIQSLLRQCIFLNWMLIF